MTPFHAMCNNRVVHNDFPARWAIRDSKICRGKTFFFSRSMLRPVLGVQPAFCLKNTSAICTAVKWPDLPINHSPSVIFEMKNKWSL